MGEITRQRNWHDGDKTTIVPDMYMEKLIDGPGQRHIDLEPARWRCCNGGGARQTVEQRLTVAIIFNHSGALSPKMRATCYSGQRCGLDFSPAIARQRS